MNIYWIELKRHWIAFTLWTIGIFFYMLSAMSKYQGYSRSGESVNDLLESLPNAFSAMFGASFLDLSSAGGFFAITILYVAVMLGVHAVLLGSGIIAKEETEKTIEFLATRPVSRSSILFAKLLAALTVVIGLNIVTLLTSLATVGYFNEGPSITGDIFLLMPGVLFIQVIFLMTGMLIATLIRRPKWAGILSAVVLLSTFIISAFVDMSERFDFLRYVTPFQYFDPKIIINEGTYDWAYVSIAAAAVIVMTVASRYAYRGRDFSI